MAKTLVPSATRQDVETILAGLVRLADQDALLVARFIPAWIELKPGEAFPKAFLVELAAILRIARWQQAGLPADLQEQFPPAEFLFDELVQAFAENPSSFIDGSYQPKWPKSVLVTWLHRFSWNAPLEIGAEVVMQEPDEDMVLGAIADFLCSLSE